MIHPTVSGLVAIAMWSLLALFTAASGEVPPFQLLAMTFLVGGLSGLPFLKQRSLVPPAIPAAAWLVGIGGLFGYHFFYYTALRHAPAAPASLIAYLWPMLIVAGSALLPGEKLRWYHLAGVALGLGGAGLLLMDRSAMIAPGHAPTGYASALVCAFVWSSYSILSRRFKAVPTDVVAWYCLACAVLSVPAHLAFETTVWPEGLVQWMAVAGLGLGPVGLAFFAWDHGVKHGNIQFLGSAAYLAPLLSTLILVLAGFAEPRWPIAVACLLIVGGAVVATGRFSREPSA